MEEDSPMQNSMIKSMSFEIRRLSIKLFPKLWLLSECRNFNPGVRKILLSEVKMKLISA